jgi:CRP-like cAMP-binding protein
MTRLLFSAQLQYLRKMPFFMGSDAEFTMALALQMRLQFFAQGEEVIREGECGDEMFFICNGSVEVLKGTQQIAILGDCQYFGEIALLNSTKNRQASVRTLKFTELRTLERDTFLETLEMYPKVKEQMFTIAEMRTKGMGGGRASMKFNKVLKSFGSNQGANRTLMDVMQTQDGQGLIRSMSLMSQSPTSAGESSTPALKTILKNVQAPTTRELMGSPKTESFSNARKRRNSYDALGSSTTRNSHPPATDNDNANASITAALQQANIFHKLETMATNIASVHAKVEHASGICLTTMQCLQSHKQVMQEQLDKLDQHQKLMEESRDSMGMPPLRPESPKPKPRPASK